MAVCRDVSLHHILRELPRVEELAGIYGWKVSMNRDALIVEVRMQAHTGDQFAVEAQCDDYKQIPPFIEFIDPDSGERGTRRAYPKGPDTFFHDSGPCICAPFNRKAYASETQPGLHGEWNLSGWMDSTEQGVKWSNHSTLAGIFGMIQARLIRPSQYAGRMEA